MAEDLGLIYAGTPRDAGYRSGHGPLPDLPLLRQGGEGSISELSYGELNGLATQLFRFAVVDSAPADN